MKKVLLLSMPFGALSRPALGISLLKAGLESKGQPCDIRYLTNVFAQYIGFEEYEWVSGKLPFIAFAGDWLFSTALYDSNPDEENKYINDVLRNTWFIDETSINRLLQIKAIVPHFLEYCMHLICWEDYSIVGFTSTFEQNLASLTFAKNIKKHYPHISLVFGGANFEGEMGLELHRKFPFMDFVCSGEADHSFPALVQHLQNPNESLASLSDIKGIIFRQNGESRYTGQATIVKDLNKLPFPDYDDFFKEFFEKSIINQAFPILLMETSRGCWWGEKSHCTFCGLNGGTMSFRSKNFQRVLDELLFLANRWQINFVEIVDNILDMNYFKDLLPALAEMGKPFNLFYEVKANLTRKHVEILYAAGVHRIQPGIESMSNHVLALMRKGTTALRNIQLLKWCHEYKIAVDWNVLYGFPGETQEDYDEMLALFPAIRFLNAPAAWGAVRLDRFSPYYDNSDLYGFINVRPMIPYSFLYPFDQQSVSKIAYYFDYDHSSGIKSDSFAEKVVAYLEEWKQKPEAGALIAINNFKDRLILIDTRSNACQFKFELTGMEKYVYEFCDELRSMTSIEQHLNKEFKGADLSGANIFGYLESLINNRLMVTDGNHYLSLAIRQHTESQFKSNNALLEKAGMSEI